MAINSSIALGFRPTTELADPVNQLAKVLAVRGAQQQQEMQRMQQDEYQRGLADENQLRELTRQAGGDNNKLRDLVYGAGNYKQGLALDKTIREGDESKGKLAEQKYKILDAATKQSRAYLDQVRTPEQYIQWHEANHADPVLGPALAARGVTAEQSRARIMQELQAPGGLERLLQQSALGMEKFTELNKPQMQTVDTGGVTQLVQTPGLGGAPKIAGQLQNTQSPNNAASVGAQYAIAQSNRDAANINAKGVRDAAAIKDSRDTEMKLADDYRAQSKPFKEVSDAYKTITTSLDKATTSPAATLAGATKFMKLLDPGSVVRESELGMALAATGVFDRAMNYHNTLLRGKVLTPQQTADFKNIAGQIYQAAQQQQQMIDKDYTTKAETYKLRPGMVVQDLGQSAKPGKVVDFGSLK
jgi:hypothetical protein